MSNLNNKTLKSVELTFENLDVIVIPSEYVEVLVIRDIAENIAYASNFHHYKKCNFFLMSIKDKFNITLVDENYGERNSFSRIMDYADIVAADLIFDDGTRESIYVDWCELDEYRNLNQSTEISETGSLVISIDDDNNEEEKVAILEADLKRKYGDDEEESEE